MRLISIFCLLIFSNIFADAFMDSVITKYSPFFSSIKHIESLRTNISVSTDYKTGKKIDSSYVYLNLKEYLYNKKPEKNIIKFIKNGKKQDPNSYKAGSILPPYPLFDKDAYKHYSFKYLKDIKILGQECRKYLVTPLGKSSQYFKGVVAISKNSKKLIYSNGTLTDLSFPLKELKIKSYFFYNNTPIPILQNGEFVYRLYIPFVLSDRYIKSKVNVKTYKIIK